VATKRTRDQIKFNFREMKAGNSQLLLLAYIQSPKQCEAQRFARLRTKQNA
jgi:hypothetical protein